MIYKFTQAVNKNFKGENYRFKNSSQIIKYLTGTGCKREASKLFYTKRKNYLQACYCFRFNYYNSIRAEPRTCIANLNLFSEKNTFEKYKIYSVSLCTQNGLTYLNENYQTMPKTISFSVEKGLKVLSVFGGAITVITFFNFVTGWTMNDFLCNPYSKALIFALLATGSIFIAPPKYREAKNKKIALATICAISVLIISGFIFFPKGNCITKSVTPLSSVPVNYDTLSHKIDTPTKEDVFNKKMPIRKDEKNKQPLVKKDSNKVGTSKYNLDKPVFNGPTQVGDGNTMNVNKGLKQRNLTMIELKDIVNRIPDKNTIIQMGLYNEAGKEGENYASQIANSLIANGYKRVQNGITQISLFSNSATDKNFDVSRTQGDDSTVMIAIYPAKNIE